MNPGDSGRTTNEHDFLDLVLGETGVLEHVFNGGHALSKEVHAEFFELCSGDLGVEVLTIREIIALYRCVMSR